MQGRTLDLTGSIYRSDAIPGIRADIINMRECFHFKHFRQPYANGKYLVWLQGTFSIRIGGKDCQVPINMVLLDYPRMAPEVSLAIPEDRSVCPYLLKHDALDPTGRILVNKIYQWDENITGGGRLVYLATEIMNYLSTHNPVRPEHAHLLLPRVAARQEQMGKPSEPRVDMEELVATGMIEADSLVTGVNDDIRRVTYERNTLSQLRDICAAVTEAKEAVHSELERKNWQAEQLVSAPLPEVKVSERENRMMEEIAKKKAYEDTIRDVQEMFSDSLLTTQDAVRKIRALRREYFEQCLLQNFVSGR